MIQVTAGLSTEDRPNMPKIQLTISVRYVTNNEEENNTENREQKSNDQLLAQQIIRGGTDKVIFEVPSIRQIGTWATTSSLGICKTQSLIRKKSRPCYKKSQKKPRTKCHRRRGTVHPVSFRLHTLHGRQQTKKARIGGLVPTDGEDGQGLHLCDTPGQIY